MVARAVADSRNPAVGWDMKSARPSRRSVARMLTVRAYVGCWGALRINPLLGGPRPVPTPTRVRPPRTRGYPSSLFLVCPNRQRPTWTGVLEFRSIISEFRVCALRVIPNW